MYYVCDVKKCPRDATTQKVDLNEKVIAENGVGSRAARFFFVETYQNGKNIPNDHKLYQT
jgi:hypothetical protein